MPNIDVSFLGTYVFYTVLIAIFLAGPLYILVVLVRFSRRQRDAAAAIQEHDRMQREVLTTLQQLLAEQREINQRLDRLSQSVSSD